MNTHRPSARRERAVPRRAGVLSVFLALVACGGGRGPTSPEELPIPPQYVAPPPFAEEVGVAPTALEGLFAWPGDGAGTVRLTFTVPANAGPVRGYDVRTSPAHLTPDPASPHFAGNAPAVPTRFGHVRPGEPVTIEAFGLESGRTMQFAVRVEFATGFGPFSHGVGLRVPGAVRGPQGPATVLTAPGTITQPGRYRLGNDITAADTAFTIEASGVELDLDGRTITYGTAGNEGKPGIVSHWQNEPALTWIHGGTIRQGAPGARSAAIEFRGGHDLRFSSLTLDVVGPDSSALVVFEQPAGDVRVDHCTIATRTETVVDRHFPGVAAIWMGGIVHGCEIDQNRITHTPQWGIYVQGNTTDRPFRIHHNEVLGTRSCVANAYMIGVYKPDADVYENELVGESRGVHVDGQDAAGLRCLLHDNRIRAQDRPNDEFPQHWTHGIRLETATDVRAYHNDVLAEADADHADAYALSISMDAAQRVQVYGNRFRARSTHAPFAAKAYVWAGGATNPPADIDVHDNVFAATDVLIQREWDGSHGGPTRNNLWLRDLAQGPDRPLLFERIDVSDIVPSMGHSLLDPITVESMDAITEWANPATWRSERRFTLRIVARDVVGQPAGGATVAVRDREDQEVATGTTDASGRLDLPLVSRVASNGPSFDSRGPFTISVQHALGSYQGTHAVTSRTALIVALDAASSATMDTSPPSAPTTLWAHALSASRVRVRWEGEADDSGLVSYLLEVDGEPRALTRVPEAILGGLDPATPISIGVRRIDAGGNTSDAGEPFVVTTWAEDRGR